MFRLDRLITLGLVRPLHKLGLRSRQYKMPILMYHSVSDEPDEKRHPYYWTNTTPNVFAEHMALLKTQGYDAVTLKTGMERLRAGTAAETKTVVLTFDDGFRNFHTEAYPVMTRYNYKATVFLPTAFIGETRRCFVPGRQNSRISSSPRTSILRNEYTGFKSQITNPQECLTWPEVRDLQKEGIEFGSHTVNHPELVKLAWPEIKTELADSKSEIEYRLGTAVESFAYPYAFPSAKREFTNQLVGLLEQFKYEYIVTTTIGRVLHSDERCHMRRLPANTADDKALLTAKLRGSYDWLVALQKAKKLFHN